MVVTAEKLQWQPGLLFAGIREQCLTAHGVPSGKIGTCRLNYGTKDPEQVSQRRRQLPQWKIMTFAQFPDLHGLSDPEPAPEGEPGVIRVCPCNITATVQGTDYSPHLSPKGPVAISPLKSCGYKI